MSNVKQYRKKPVVVEAIQWLGSEPSFAKIKEFVGSKWEPGPMGTRSFYIVTLEGDMLAQENDWIIKGVQGEFYPCKPDIFEATYEPVD